MKAIELLWFEDVNPFNEAVFEFPIVGKLSMRQMLILGFGMVLSWSMYQSTANYASLIPILVCAYIVFKKHKVRSTESQILAVLLFYMRIQNKNTKKSIQRIKVSKSRRMQSKRLRAAEPYRPKLDQTVRKINVREIYADPLKPIRLKIQLQKIDGQIIANTETKIVFDGRMISTLSTDDKGELEAIVIAQTSGEKKLEIYAKGVELPVYEEIISIK